ncbi:MAG TPA: serine/threonine-protein kinase [Vicinamibacterales bacterium]|jgi:serine/threonine-protein kinase|nr:serine/threonine-protein kinase [Vicinamibacterales bacterium]
MRDSVGHYKILDKLGSGAMGELYRARDTRVGRTVALRAVAPAIAGDPATLADFLRNARASATVSHPNIAAIYEVGEDDGLHYLAGEFVAGQKLKSLIAGRPLNPRRAIDLTVQMADALADGYANEIVDGSLSADTIIINPKGNAKLLDFGLARWRAGGKGRPAADHQSDIAALGAVLHEMLTGTAPQHGLPPSELDSQLPRELDAIVHRTQSTYLNEQYQVSATLAAELRSVAAILDVRATAANEVAAAPPRGARRRETFVWIAAVATIAAFAWLLWTVSRIK